MWVTGVSWRIQYLQSAESSAWHRETPATCKLLLFYCPSPFMPLSSQLAGEPPEGRAVADSSLRLLHLDAHMVSNKYLLN